MSWNVAMLKPSHQAPPDWTAENTEDAVLDAIEAERPGLLHLQELPTAVGLGYIEGYVHLDKTTESHCGCIHTYVRSDLAGLIEDVRVLDRFCVLTQLRLPSGAGLQAANVHLLPHKQNAGNRLAQASEILSCGPELHTLVAGDTNTRQPEAAEWRRGLGLVGEMPAKQHTWDGFANRFHGPETFKFRSSFSRLFHSKGVHVDHVRILKDPIERGGRRFFLSDHHAFVGTLSVPPSE